MRTQCSDSASIWFCARNGKRSGPYTTAELWNSLKSRVLGSKDLVWREGMMKWEPIGSVNVLSSDSHLDDQRQSQPCRVESLKLISLRNIAIAQKVLILAIVSYGCAMFWSWWLLVTFLPIYCAILAFLCFSLKWNLEKTAIALLINWIPYVGVLSLLCINQNATHILVQNGFKVGFLGVPWKALPPSGRLVPFASNFAGGRDHSASR